MPKLISSDGGKTWKQSKSPFPALGGGQRPTLIRLQSGLFFAGDCQGSNGIGPEGMHARGAYVALSEDGGETWTIKKLPGTLPVEPEGNEAIDRETIGYAVARQAPNGVIHLITTKKHPSFHFELNEAWLLTPEAGMPRRESPMVTRVEHDKETYRFARYTHSVFAALFPT